MPRKTRTRSRRRARPPASALARRPAAGWTVSDGLVFGRKLGINVTEDDAIFLGFTALQALISPESARDRIRLVSSILERSVPDTQLTRRKLGRLLEGVSALSEAGAVLLTIEGYDILAEIRRAADDALSPMTRKGRPLSEEDLATAAFVFWHGAMRIIRDLKAHPDPRVRSAMRTLARAGDLLDPSQKLPDVR
jgi:hypothetical protein